MKKFFRKLKEKWNRYLERLAESNKELYGNQRLDCCGLNKSREQGQKNNNK